MKRHLIGIFCLLAIGLYIGIVNGLYGIESARLAADTATLTFVFLLWLDRKSVT